MTLLFPSAPERVGSPPTLMDWYQQSYRSRSGRRSLVQGLFSSGVSLLCRIFMCCILELVGGCLYFHGVVQY
eukprot:13765260-Ditylum_brightwellii.AAC.1